MKVRGFPILAVLCAIALAPAGAFAASGDDQYCDPFGGCGGTTTTTTTPSKPNRPSGGGNSTGSAQGPSNSGHGSQAPLAFALVQAVQSQSASQIEQGMRASAENPIALAIYERALKAKRASAVLDEAGLSALRVLVSLK